MYNTRKQLSVTCLFANPKINISVTMRCTKCNRPTKGHKKPTGKHCSLLPIISDVAEESHKWTNTNGISPDMRRREQHRKQYKTRLLGRPQPQMYPPVTLNQHTWVNRTHKHYASRPHKHLKITPKLNNM